MAPGSLRFVLSRRWAVFALVVVALAWAAWWLGEWQFHRLEDRKARNAVVRVNEDRPVAPVDEVLAPGRGVAAGDEWRLVSATGVYDAQDTVVVRYRSRDDHGTGIDVVVPLVTADGTALLVDRGFVETDPQGTDRSVVPDPPAGEVEVTGWVRADGTGDSTRVDDLSTRALNSGAVGAATGSVVYGGFVELASESVAGSPAPATGLVPVELPELDNGPHFFYGLQWWFFGLLAVFGFFYLMLDEWRHGPRAERAERAQRARSAGAEKARRRRELVAAAEARRTAGPGSGPGAGPGAGPEAEPQRSASSSRN